MGRYEGAAGRTRKQRIHYTCPDGSMVVTEVYVSVDASTDPELAQRLLADDPGHTLNVIRVPGEKLPRPISVPVVYHAPDNELLVLVLPVTSRHRELAERAALLTAMAEDTSAPAPPYAREFRVAYGAAGLRALLETAAERQLVAQRLADQSVAVAADKLALEERSRELADQQAELERLAAQLDRSQRDLDALSQTLDDREAALDRRTAELERATKAARAEAARAEAARAEAARAAEAARVDEAAHAEAARAEVARVRAPSTPVVEPVPAAATVPFETFAPADLETSAAPLEAIEEYTDSIEADIEAVPLEEGEVIAADQLVSESAPARASGRPVSQDGETRIGGATDVAIEKWIVSRDKFLKLVDDAGTVRLAVCAEADELDCLMGERLGMKLQLHQLPSYPLVTMTFGRPATMRGDDHGTTLVFFFDVAMAEDRAVLDALAREFTFRLELYDNEYLAVKQRTVTAELDENVRYVLSAADARLVELGERERSFDRAIIAYDDPKYDRLGADHRERREFRPDKLGKLDRGPNLRRALAMARRFSRPEREDYLVSVRGYSLPEWRSHRRAVIEHAIDTGLWIGQTLSKVAISEGIVGSRAALVRAVHENFTRTIASGNHDLDDDTIDDNWNDIEAAATDYGVTLRKGTASSEHAPVASGTIGGTGSGSAPRRRTSVTGATPPVAGSGDQLVAQLEDDRRRLEAAIELARRGDRAAVGPVFNTLRRMTRGEAVRLLGFSVGFGDGATPHLIDGLRSRKAYLRQGCALALAIIGSEQAVEAVCDQLVSEPTEIWREIARGLGQVGAGAIMSLAARLAGHGERGQERVAWALAHVAARGDDSAVKALAQGRDPAAATAARRGLELVGRAQRETAEILGADAPAELTVNRAFSRSFFEAAEHIMPGAAPALVRDAAELTGPAMLLSEADLIEAPEFEDAEPLDESDLIPT